MGHGVPNRNLRLLQPGLRWHRDVDLRFDRFDRPILGSGRLTAEVPKSQAPSPKQFSM
jgi:hypothetical protein